MVCLGHCRVNGIRCILSQVAVWAGTRASASAKVNKTTRFIVSGVLDFVLFVVSKDVFARWECGEPWAAGMLGATWTTLKKS